MLTKSRRDLNVLGICSTGHGAALALVSAKHGIRALTLDRFVGHKHCMLFTRRELDEITSGATPIDHCIFEALTYSYRRFPRSYVIEETFLPFLQALLRGLPLRPDQIDTVVTSNSHFGFNAGRVGSLLTNFFPNAEIVRHLEHHTIHQWQAFLPSPFSEAAILCLDESGEPLERINGNRIAISMAVAYGVDLRVLKEHTHPESSPGLVYAEFCRHLNYHSGEEGKLMGLAPYGSDCVYRTLASELKLFEDGSFRFIEGGELCNRLRVFTERRPRNASITPIHADIAYAGQRILERILVNSMVSLSRLVPSDVTRVAVSGGVALNSCANEIMFRASRFQEIYISPNPGDDGHALACALYGARVHNRQSIPVKVPDDYLGPPYTDEEIEASLIEAGLEFTESDPDDVARLLAQGCIVALFQGGSEYGPRALGNRSILADPRRSEMTDVVNERVKHRELFRPYAPVVPEEKAHLWFDHRGPNPFMLRVVGVLPEKQDRVGAITHIDGSARVQTVTRDSNPRLHSLIEAFERRTGIPVLMNTSFNIAGRPIVETPTDAIECFQSTGIDILLAGRFQVVKSRNGVQETNASDPKLRKAREDYQRLQNHARNSLAVSQAN